MFKRNSSFLKILIFIFCMGFSNSGYSAEQDGTGNFNAGTSALFKADLLMVPFKIFSEEDLSLQRRTIMDKLALGLNMKGLEIRGIDKLKTIYVEKESDLTNEEITGLSKNVNADFVLRGSITKLKDIYSVDLKLSKGSSFEELTLKYITATTFKELVENIKDVAEELYVTMSENVEVKPVTRTGKIEAINVIGNIRVDALAVTNKTNIKVGDKVDQSAIKDSIFNIYSLGYFTNIGVDLSNGESGKILTYLVSEKPYVKKIIIKGNDDISEERLLDIISIKENTMIDPVFIGEDKERIKLFYKMDGFYLASVEVDVEVRGINATVTYTINEGQKVKIKRITFIGNKAVKERKLKDLMKTREKGLFSFMSGSGLYNVQLFRNDLNTILNYYFERGYIKTDLSDFRVLLSEDKKWFYITVAIDEGKRYKFNSITIDGDMLEDVTTEDLLDEMLLDEGDYFNRTKFSKSMDGIGDIYGEQGYANADIEPNTKIDEENSLVDVTLNIKKNELVYVGKITIDGNIKTRDNVIRREIEVGEKELFYPSALKRSNNSLNRLGYFESALIVPSPGSDENSIDVNVSLKERPTGTLTASVGYSTTDKVVTTFAINQSNLFGKGYKLNLSANFSATTKKYNLGFTNPWLMGKPISGGFDVYNTIKDFPDFVTTTQGFNLRLGWRIYKRIGRANLSYSYQNVNVSDVDALAAASIQEQEGNSKVSSVGGGIRFDTRDNLFFPREGYIFRLNGTVAGGKLGGTTNYYEYTLEGAKIFPLPYNTSFTTRTKWGYIDSFSGHSAPVYKRYYIGGLNTIRGFETRSISPRDEVTGEKIGGDMMALASTEFMFPLFGEQALRGVAFFDIGNSFTHDTIEKGDFRRGIGAGIRWLSPMGPLRIEWGYNLDWEPGEKQSLWDFTIGTAF